MKLYQPYPKLSPIYFPEFLKENKRYFISQSYPRGEIRRWGEEPKIPLVFSLYENQGLAKVHLSALREDKYAVLIDLKNPAHKNKITAMMEQDSKYEVFIAMVWKNSENDSYIKKHYARHIERFTASKDWHIPKTDSVDFQFKIIFGQPHLAIKWRNNELEVKFEDIEKA